MSQHLTPLFPGPDPPRARGSHLAIIIFRKGRPHNNRRAGTEPRAPPAQCSPPIICPPATSSHSPLSPGVVRDRRPLPHPPQCCSTPPPPITRVSRTLCDSGNSSDVRRAVGRGGGRGRWSRGGGSCLGESSEGTCLRRQRGSGCGAGALECSPLHCCCCCCVTQSSRPEVRHGVEEVRGLIFLKRVLVGWGQEAKPCALRGHWMEGSLTCPPPLQMQG